MSKSKTRSPTDLNATIGEMIKTGRSLRGISQEQLAAKIGVTFQQLQKYENGTNRVAASRLYLIARTLELPLAYFFGGKDILPRKIDLKLDDDSVEIMKTFQSLSKPNRRIVRDFLAQFAKAA